MVMFHKITLLTILFYQIIAALVSVRDVFQQHYQKSWPQTFEQ